jgi:hypothetical protein
MMSIVKAPNASSAYEGKFMGIPPSPMKHLIWLAGTPPKCKFFSWLVFQNRLWTADRLIDRGWLNQKVCMLCHDHDEERTTSIHQLPLKLDRVG